MTRTADVPLYSYLIAVFAGLFGLPLIYIAARFVSEIAYAAADYDGLQLVFAAGFAAVHVALGAVFGFLWPEVRWRWGVWLCAAPACLVSFYAPGVWFFVVWLALTMLPAGAGAHAAGRLHLRYAGVD